MKLSALFLLCLFLVCCNKKEKVAIFGTKNLPTQTFQVDPLKDTTLITSGQCRISILAGSFSSNGPVIVEIKEAVRIGDMVRAGLTTMAGTMPLQSGGVIFITATQNGSMATILQPIEISLPTSAYNPEMKLFSGEWRQDNSINWKNPELPLSRSERQLTDTGKLLFNYCATCHSIDKNLTGPALAFVTERRCMDWLKKEIRNPQKMVETDACLREQQKKYLTAMTAFVFSDAQIEAIYSYIAKESEKYRNNEGSPSSFDPCGNLVLRDTTTIERTVTSKRIGNIRDQQKNKMEQDQQDPINGTSTATEGKKVPSEYYTFTINSFGWYNIDCYVERNRDVATASLFVRPAGGDDEDLSVYLIIPAEKIFMMGNKDQSGRWVFYEPGGSIPLPQNKTAYILAFKSFVSKPVFGQAKFTTSTQHDIVVNLRDNADIDQEIKAMNLDNFEFEASHVKMQRKMSINERLYLVTCATSRPTDTLTNSSNMPGKK